MRRARRRRRRIASPILAGIGVIGLLGGAVIGLARVPIVAVQTHGIFQQVSQEEILTRVNRYTAWGWVRLPVDRMRRELEQVEWVASAEIRRSWPLALSVEITERRPVARLGEHALLDETGERFIPGEPVNRSLPLLRGPAGSEAQLLESYRAFSARLGSRSLALDRLSLDPRGAWRLVLRNGPELRLGAESLDLRLERALLALDQLAEGNAAEIDYVDLRYPNGLAVAFRAPDAASRKQGGESP